MNWTESDFELLAQIEPNFAHRALSAKPQIFRPQSLPVSRLRELGFSICLGTDSLASNDDLSLFAEMRHFATFPEVSPEKILAMVTTHPARALQQETALGRIEAGHCG